MSSDKSSTVARPSSNSNSQVTRPTTSSSSSSGSRPGTGATTRGNSNSGSIKGGNDNMSGNSSTVIRHSDNSNVNVTRDNSSALDRTSTSSSSRIDKTGNKPNGGIKPDNGGKPNGGGKPDNGGKPNGGGKPDGNGNGHGGNGHGGNHGYDHNNHFDYSGHHYGNDFHRNYHNHSWSWSRPLPPPARPYRPAPIVWYRPVIPTGWYPYASAPIIDRILGITFGTLFDISLDYLYYNGYEIDGYADHIIYLRDVPLLGLTWDDVMFCYDTYDRLVNAQFVFMGSNHKRYDRVYRKLCRIYGTPFSNSDGTLSWYGGNNTGWITLSAHTNLGYYYTTLSIGY